MWYNVESTTRPELTDTTSSKKWNYVRRNIREEQRTDENGETYTVFVFEEQKIDKNYWEMYKAIERNSANIDYIAMMSDIEIEDGEEDE